jgi:hypothetical protein
LSAANEAAAGLAPEIASELIARVPAAAEDDRLAADLREISGSVEAPVASSEEAAVAQEDEQETVEPNVPNYTPEIPEDLLEDLEEPDFEAEAATELAADDEYVYDEQDSEERRLRIAAEKKLAWIEGRLQDQNKSKWRAEATKYFPLSEHSLDSIQADSRRSFLRQAKAEHEKVLPYVKPLIERLGATAEEVKAQAKQEGRAEARAAWGQPTTGPGTVPTRGSADEQELEDARKTGNLAKIIGVMMKQGR